MAGNNKIIWSEGMFLQPQHFQQHDRYWDHLIDERMTEVAAYGWGFSKLELDSAALTLGKVQLLAGRGVFPDGTPFNFPAEDAPPLPLDIDSNMRDELLVLALPLRKIGLQEACLPHENATSLARYQVAEQHVSDANLDEHNEVLLQVGQLRLKLMRNSDITDAYTTLGVVKIVERRADNQLTLNRHYIPPLLHALADSNLSGYARELHGLLQQRAEALAVRVAHPGRSGVADVADFLLLQTVNRYTLLFRHFSQHVLLHPEKFYTVCLQLASELATFSHESRRPPDYPGYQHDNLELSFAFMVNDLRRSLSLVLESKAIAIDLQTLKHGVRMATFPDRSLLKSANFVFAINAQMPAEALRTRFPTQVKIGPVEKIKDLVNLSLPGIPLYALQVAPRQIPFHAGFSYFELEQGGDLWRQLESASGLAMHVAGDFPGLEIEFWAIRD